MNTLIDSFINELRLTGAKDNTIKTARSVLTQLSKYKPLENCAADDVKAFLMGKKSQNTKALYQIFLKQFFGCV